MNTIKFNISIIALILCFMFVVESKIYVENIFLNGTKSVFATAPVKLEGNTDKFGNITGILARLNATREERKGKIVGFNNRFWQEDINQKMIDIMKDEPIAIISFGGAIQRYRHNFGEMPYRLWSTSTKQVTVPVVQVYQDDWGTLRDKYLNRFNEVVITISDFDESEFKPFITGGFIIFWMVTVNLFCLINIIIASYILIRSGIRPNIASIILSLEILANILRILYAIDPYGPIPIFGYDFTVKIYTTSLPLDLASAVLLAFYWHELVTNTSMESSGFVSKFRIPAFLIISFFIVFEIITAAFRGTPQGDEFQLSTINAILYFIFILILVIYYTVVSIKVFRYISKLKQMRRAQNLLYQVTIRASISIIGMVCLVIGGVLTATDVTNVTLNEYIVLYLIMQSLNLISIAHIAAFKVTPSGGSKSSQRDSEKETAENSLNISSKEDERPRVSKKGKNENSSSDGDEEKGEAQGSGEEEEGEEEDGESDGEEEGDEGEGSGGEVEVDEASGGQNSKEESGVNDGNNEGEASASGSSGSEEGSDEN